MSTDQLEINDFKNIWKILVIEYLFDIFSAFS